MENWNKVITEKLDLCWLEQSLHELHEMRGKRQAHDYQQGDMLPPVDLDGMHTDSAPI